MNNKILHECTNHVVIDLTHGDNHHHHDGINEVVDLQAWIEQEFQQELEIQRHIEEELMMEAKNHQCMEEEEEEQCHIQAEHDCE